MKSFYIALCVLILLGVVIALNYIYINKVSNRLILAVEEVRNSPPNKTAQRIAELEALWNKEKTMISMSVGYVTINKIDDTIASLKAACDEKSQYDFHNHISILKNAVSELARLEKLSVFNVL